MLPRLRAEEVDEAARGQGETTLSTKPSSRLLATAEAMGIEVEG